MVGPELGRETDAIAESVLLIIRSARKVVRSKPDQPDRRRRHCVILKPSFLTACSTFCAHQGIRDGKHGTHQFKDR